MLFKCPQCGENNLSVLESTLWVGTFNDFGVIEIHKSETSEVDNVVCRNCGREFSEKELEKIKYNWQ